MKSRSIEYCFQKKSNIGSSSCVRQKLKTCSDGVRAKKRPERCRYSEEETDFKGPLAVFCLGNCRGCAGAEAGARDAEIFPREAGLLLQLTLEDVKQEREGEREAAAEG